MSQFSVDETIGGIVARRPALSRVFERMGIDYCCGGKRTLREAALARGLDPAALVGTIEKANVAMEEISGLPDPLAMSLTELADHIEQTHHAYLRSELPRLNSMARKVAAVHGENDRRLDGVKLAMSALAEELTMHMMKEEQILFPMVRELEGSEEVPAFHCGCLANPIRQMELEHEQAGSGLEVLRALTDEFTTPDWACNTYRAMLDGLAQLDRDMRQHVHKENNVLFPRAMALEAEKGAARTPSMAATRS